ncbi:8587_t:CDS:1, partial [Rhizophagus irregularis]
QYAELDKIESSRVEDKVEEKSVSNKINDEEVVNMIKRYRSREELEKKKEEDN